MEWNRRRGLLGLVLNLLWLLVYSVCSFSLNRSKLCFCQERVTHQKMNLENWVTIEGKKNEIQFVHRLSTSMFWKTGFGKLYNRVKSLFKLPRAVGFPCIVIPKQKAPAYQEVFSSLVRFCFSAHCTYNKGVEIWPWANKVKRTKLSGLLKKKYVP